MAIYWPNLPRPIATIVWGEGIIMHDYDNNEYGECVNDFTKRLSNTTKLDDDSPMPFGIHKGKRLGDVPDSYFRWFLGEYWCDNWSDIVQYANHVLED